MPNRRIRTIIVDDEELARRGLELRLRDAADVEVVAHCANGREALAAINEHHPDLVFLDIQMPGLDGFEVLRQLPPSNAPLIVFVTAFDQYAIDAFDAQALDYLLKPVNDERLTRALGRVRAQLASQDVARQQEKLAELIARLTDSGHTSVEELLSRAADRPAGQYLDILPVRQGRETVRVPVPRIDWIDAAGDYMCVHAEGRTYVVRGTMKDFESALDPRVFQRVHRSTMVNVNRVRSLRPHTNGEYFLTLDSGHELKLSRSYRDRLEALLGKT